MTGWARGYCAGYGRGGGYGRFGRGLGRGFASRWSYPAPGPYEPVYGDYASEEEMLKAQMKDLEQDLKDVKDRLDRIASEKKS
jgi:hypothetical protein